MIKVNFQNMSSRLSLILLALLLHFSFFVHAQADSAVVVDSTVAETPAANLTGDATAGEALFKANCAACHKLDSKATGPALRGVGTRLEKEWLHSWIKNSLAVIASGDAEANKIYEEFNKAVMPPFPQLSDTDIDNILAYVDQPKAEPVAAVATTATAGSGSGDSGGGVSNTIILGVLALVLLLLVIMLILVTNTLKKIAQANGVDYPEKQPRTPLWKTFIHNQFLVLVSSLFLFLIALFFVFGYLMQVGVDQGYAPVQPIHFSHKIHAGDNKIDCNFCHSSARVSKTSGIPSLNVCMNCHKNISEYAGDVVPEKGYTKEFYDAQIAKLYDAAGWDVNSQSYTGVEKPVKWERIHNLPDFAYFNHSQHVTVAGVACQKCHGPIEEMEIVGQFAPLTMGWCITCHKETNVNLAGNEYYEKIHSELSKKYGVEQLTAAQMGGLECGKCHY